MSKIPVKKNQWRPLLVGQWGSFLKDVKGFANFAYDLGCDGVDVWG